MDPLTRFLGVVEAMLKLVQTISEGQPPDVREQLWRWFVQDLAWWRKALKIDKE